MLAERGDIMKSKSAVKHLHVFNCNSIRIKTVQLEVPLISVPVVAGATSVRTSSSWSTFSWSPFRKIRVVAV
jgi:hypothetical protein